MFPRFQRKLLSYCTGTYDLRVCCNGVLSGLVTVTCMCGFVDPWAAVVCSGIAGALYTGSSQLLLRCGIDDPLDSSTVHLGNGLLGTILLAFFAKPEHVMALTGSPCGGVFYSSSGWLQLGLQLLGKEGGSEVFCHLGLVLQPARRRRTAPAGHFV